MTKFKVGDRVEVIVDHVVAYSKPERRWMGVQGTVLNVTGSDPTDFVEIGDLSIDYVRPDVNFFVKSLKLVEPKSKKPKGVPFKDIKDRLKEAKDAHKESMEQLALASSVDEMVTLRMDVEFNNGLIAALEELLESHRGNG